MNRRAAQSQLVAVVTEVLEPSGQVTQSLGFTEVIWEWTAGLGPDHRGCGVAGETGSLSRPRALGPEDQVLPHQAADRAGNSTPVSPEEGKLSRWAPWERAPKLKQQPPKQKMQRKKGMWHTSRSSKGLYQLGCPATVRAPGGDGEAGQQGTAHSQGPHSYALLKSLCDFKPGVGNGRGGKTIAEEAAGTTRRQREGVADRHQGGRQTAQQCPGFRLEDYDG